MDFIRKCGWKKNKAFAYRVPIRDYNYLQCIITWSFQAQKLENLLFLVHKLSIVFIFILTGVELAQAKKCDPVAAHQPQIQQTCEM